MDKEVINKYKDLYFKKAKSNETEFQSTLNMRFHSTEDFPECNEGWFTYAIDNKNSIFYIGSLFYNGNDKNDTNRAFIYLKQFAKRKDCKKIIFWTARNGKLWKRRFKEMKVTGWRMEVGL